MKLPEFRTPRRGSLPRESLGVAAQQQRNKLGVFGAVTNLADNLARQKIESDTAEQNSAYGDFVSQVEQEMAAVESLTPQQLRDAGLEEADGVQLVDAGGADRDYLLRHEWYPQLMNKRMEAAEEEYGNKIMHAPSRKAWQAEQRTRRQDYVGRLAKQSAADAQKLLFREAEAKMADDQANGRWQSMIDRAQSNPSYYAFPDKRQAWVEAAQFGRFEQGVKLTMATEDSEAQYGLANQLLDESNDYPATMEQRVILSTQLEASATQARREEVEELTEANSAQIIAGNVSAIESAIKTLRAEEFKTNSNGTEIGVESGLTRRESLTELRRLGQGLSAVRAKQTAADTNYLARQRGFVDRTLTAAEDNPLLDPHELDRAEAALKQVEQHHLDRGKQYTDQADANRLEKLNQARRENAAAREISIMPLGMQHGLLTNLQGRDQTVEVTRGQQMIDKIIENSERELASNSIRYARSLGWQIDELPSMNDPSYFEALSTRVDTDAAIATHWGKSSGPLDEVAELPILMNQLKEMDQEQRNNWFGATVMTMGEEKSKVLFEQMFEDDDYMPAMTGVLVAENAMDVALQIQSGAAYRKDPNFQMRDRITVRQDINEALGDAYGRGPQRGARMKAIMDHIAYQMIQAEGGAASEGSDYVDTAIEAVTGGMVNIHGSTVEVPARGISKTQVNQFVDHFEDNPQDLPNIAGAKKESIAREWGGRFRLEPSESVGVYYIRDRRGKNRLGTDGGSLLMAADDEGNPTGVPAMVEFFKVNPPLPYVSRGTVAR